jgi:hypothetical protein
MLDSLDPLIAIAQRGIANAGGSSMKVHPCDASCKKVPPDASQNLGPPPQAIEKQGLETS